MTVQAIETKYKGYRFRSRTEARWAVFFDDLGIPYEYEKEGFDLPHGKYLPDFWIPTWEAFVEVKGVAPTPEELDLMLDLKEATGHKGFFLSGQPGDDYRVWIQMNAGGVHGAGKFKQCIHCPNIWVYANSGVAERCSQLGHPDKHPDCLACRAGIFSESGITYSLDTAKSARFEYGEEG